MSTRGSFRSSLALAVALAGFGGALWWRRASAAQRAAVVNRGSVRNLRVARLGARSGRRYAVSKARATFASAERRQAIEHEFQLQTAADVTAELGNMKGALMKIGQMASYIDTGLPEPVRQTLASLQSDAPPMSPELAAETVQAELGDRPEACFAEWDPVPIAAASIGQVHRAITHDGRAVAVKVQYPGVADAVRADLGNAGWLFGGLANMFPGLDPEPVIEELRNRLSEELDYENEAANQRRFAEFFDGHPYIRVPAVVDELSTARVLTTELAAGARFEELLTWSRDEQNLAAETIFRFSFGSVYRLHSFNGDPHPGNYLFEPGGRVTFLDFGLVKTFTEAETSLFRELIEAMVVNRDGPAFRAAIERGGLIAPGAPFSDEQVADYFRFYYRYVLEDEVITIDGDYARGGVEQLLDASGDNGDLMRQLNVPAAFVVLQRITLGLVGLLADLEATGNFRRIAMELWPWVSAEPSTPMGVEIAAWRARRSQPPLGL